MRNSNRAIGGTWLFMMSVIIVALGLMVNWTDGNLDWLVSKLSGHAVDVPTWLSAIITFVGNGVVLIFNVICEIAKLVG